MSNFIVEFNTKYMKQFGENPKFISSFRVIKEGKENKYKTFSTCSKAQEYIQNKTSDYKFGKDPSCLTPWPNDKKNKYKIIYIVSITLNGQEYVSMSDKNLKDARSKLCQSLLLENSNKGIYSPLEKQLDHLYSSLSLIRQMFSLYKATHEEIISSFIHRSVIKKNSLVVSKFQQNYKIGDLSDYGKYQKIGKSVISLGICEHLVTDNGMYKKYKDALVLSGGRYNVEVNNLVSDKKFEKLNDVMGLTDYMIYDGKSGDIKKYKLYIDVIESMIGVIYFTEGLDLARKFVKKYLIDLVC